MCYYVLVTINQNKTSRANAGNIGDPALTRTVKELTVKAITHSTDSPQSSNSESFNLQLSADIDEARANVELLKQMIIESGQNLLYWQNRLNTLENQIPEINSHLIGQLRNVLANIK